MLSSYYIGYGTSCDLIVCLVFPVRVWFETQSAVGANVVMSFDWGYQDLNFQSLSFVY